MIERGRCGEALHCSLARFFDAALDANIVTDGNERPPWRHAGSRGWRHQVHAVSSTPFSLAGVSWSVRPHVSPAIARAASIRRRLGALAPEVRADVLLPVTDGSVEALLGHRDLLPRRLAIPLPELETYRTASDKQAMLPMAREAGFDVPDSLALESRNAPGLASTWFPAVLKPHRSLAGGRKTSVMFVDDEHQALRALGSIHPDAFPVLLQKRVHGPGVGVFPAPLARTNRRGVWAPPPSGKAARRWGLSVPGECTARPGIARRGRTPP